MSDKKSVNFLPEYLRSDKNNKFLSSTIDQLIAKPQLERIDGYVGSKLTPNYNPGADIYIRETLPLRKNYQLEPALVLQNSVNEINDVIGFDDIINELTIQGAKTENLDKLFRPAYYSYDPLIDWDKLINYTEYYWLPNGPSAVNIDNSSINVLGDIVGQESYLLPSGHKLTNGLKVIFSQSTGTIVSGKEYIIEGVGKSIELVDFEKLQVNEGYAENYNETFDSDAFDVFPYDSDTKLPIRSEYVTINKASKDLNPWSRYNRWFHSEVIKTSAEINGELFSLPTSAKARRPIVEFKANLQLYNFGTTGKENVDLLDNTTTDAFAKVVGAAGYYVDGVLLAEGHRVIFNADNNDKVKGKIYRVTFVDPDNPALQTLRLIAVESPSNLDSISVNLGNSSGGKSFYYSETQKSWQLSQQHTFINQAPLFDLFNKDGESYSQSGSINDFQGTRIFGYAEGTGKNDEVLGFPLKYQSGVGIGSYLFNNYFMTDVITITEAGQSRQIKTGIGYLKINNPLATTYFNVWKTAEETQVPIIELQIAEETTATVFVRSLDKPFNTATQIISYVNNVQVPNVTSFNTNNIQIDLEEQVVENDVIKFEILTDQIPNDNGYYDVPLSLTNNPLNADISNFTLSELSDHVGTMIGSISNFEGKFPGNSNLRDIDGYAKFGKRLVINKNPIAFAKIFLGKSDHNVLNALRYGADQYNQYKINFIQSLDYVDSQITPAEAVDTVLKFINKNKDNRSAYFRSDMVPYGSDKNIKEYAVSGMFSAVFPIGLEYSSTSLSFKSVLVYVNDVQLVLGRDYIIDSIDEQVELLLDLEPADIVSIHTYSNTQGSYVPPTPTKLGLYPKFIPEIYEDDSYQTSPVKMIQCHDGSVIKAFDDYRDDIILEFERRIYNNIKVNYNSDFFDIAAVLPGAFRNSKYSRQDAVDILTKEFIKWAGVYNVDFKTNEFFDEGNAFTFNYSQSLDTVFNSSVPGNWKGIYNYFYDTIRPNTHPWEMLGFAEKPTWWEGVYGAAPYTSSNTLLWNDLENGFDRGNNLTKESYKRPGLSNIIPVDSFGNLRSPDVFLVSDSSYSALSAKWKFGDYGPAEMAWRRSSYYPFVINLLAALFDPCTYTSLMYDVSRLSFNNNDQILYNNELYISPTKLFVDADNNQTAGYGNLVVEKGTQVNLNYLSLLNQDLTYCDFNLFYKLGGFTNKEKLQVVIDSIDPTSTGQGAVLPPEDYSLILNVSNPIKASRISGIIVQLVNGKFSVKGYDKAQPYFQIYKPLKSFTSEALSIGGTSAPFVDYITVVPYSNKGLTNADLTSAETVTSKYYKQGQIVRYNSRYYRVKVGHTTDGNFNSDLFQPLSSLPIVGGVQVNLPAGYENKITSIPYGSEFSTVQEVFDFIMGYGKYLETEGFIFDEYNNDLLEVLDWKFAGKEFLYWTTQNWADGNLITLSPFADSLKYQFADSVVDNITGKNYEYSLLKADGRPFPIENFTLSRDDGVCKIQTLNTQEGIFFAVLYLVQKEHAMVFNNSTIFNDTIYDIESGYRQRRIKLAGFRTANWNGDYSSPGFVFDNVQISDWEQFKFYQVGTVVRFNGVYYEAAINVDPEETFDFNKWVKLNKKPVPQLLPNFDYRINQFEDFYSLDIDNFDSSQQQLSQRLTGYIQRPYLSNIFTNPITQYKFYQGFIREKGTKNALDKISKAGTFTRQGTIDFKEEWAFRVGNFGGFETYKEYEFTLEESTERENPYIVKFVDKTPSDQNPLINYTSSTGLLIKPEGYVPTEVFPVYQNSTYIDNNVKLLTAGYVNPDDVTATAFNKDSLLDVANNSAIQDKDTIWLGFLENGSWTVYRYTRQTAKIAGVFVSAPAEEITFVTDIHHGLTVDDIVSVVNFNEQVNGVYRVTSTPKLNQFTVASELATIVNEELLAYGALFKFENARFNNFQAVSFVRDLHKLGSGDKIWIDQAPEKWAVYEKTKNYNVVESVGSPSKPAGQQLGHTIFATDDSPIVLISSPTWDLNASDSRGRVAVFEKFEDSLTKQFEYILNSNNKTYCENNTATDFGYALAYDIEKELFIASAPAASKVRASNTGSDVIFSTGTGNIKSFDNEGLVKISSRKQLIDFEETKFVLLAPEAFADTEEKAANLRFGQSIYTNQVNVTNSTTFLIGAPGDGVVNTSTGHVFCYYLNTTTTGNVVISSHSQGISLQSNVTLSTKSQFGRKISGSLDGQFIAVTAPSHIQGNLTGVVQIYNDNLEWKQTLYSPFNSSANFGTDIAVSSSGKFLLVSSTEVKESGQPYGRVAVYTATNLTSSGTYVLRQIIENPEFTNDLKFGHSISLSKDENTLIISSLGINRSKFAQFDIDSKEGETTFDNDITRFVDPVGDSGAVYVYNNLDDYFVIADELKDVDIVEGSRYGYALAATNVSVFVGAPWYSVSTENDDKSAYYQYRKIDESISSWKLLSYQEDLVEVESINRVALINSIDEKIIDYLDVIDPVKGKIAGIAEQELKYKMSADPAIYTIGTLGTVNDDQTNWIDDHVGELWWDLSTAKYMWYEQGSEIYRKNNWGRLFPGASIDVYEWVKSDLLPSEWAAQADTSEGLTKGISGQPKYPDNTILSVKQVWNSTTNSYNNVYYFWVKNKVTVPNVKNRRISSFQVSSLIADPVANGIKHTMMLGKDSVAFANINTSLVGNDINVNIAVDTIKNSAPRHTEWILLQEGESNSRPTALLDKKLFDSLLGHDSLGNLVPDHSLSYRNRYGIGIRPQQTFFKDRLEALRNLTEYANSVLIKELITGNFDFTNLLAAEEIPNIEDGGYDLILDEIFELDLIDTTNFERAELSFDTFNGKIVGVEIINPGFGYSYAPGVKIISDTGSGAKISTQIDSNGRVVTATVVDRGTGYTSNTIVEVRPYTVIVRADSTFGGRWTEHSYDYKLNSWFRVKTQGYNTPLYWKYVNWVSTSYNEYKDYRYVLDNTYELGKVVDILPGDYVKIKNSGDGRFIVLERVANNVVGNFSTAYNIVYSERGTIQILDSIWNYSQSNYAYDIATFEETLYDQQPDGELKFILQALKDDIFIRSLKVYWNLFFFKAVKYALTEQKLLDWAFKTSFISVDNTIGSLDQRPVYKSDNEKYFEDYIKEVKPYRTKIRNYVSRYNGIGDNGIELAELNTTDFDLPAFFNSATNKFEVVELGNTLLNESPWKDWYDNYKYSVEKVLVADGGSGYTQRPTVVFTTASGDTGSGAAAEAYLRNGTIYNIVVTDSGSGYTQPPIISLVGGGDNVVTATMSVILGNNPVRKNNITLKFDRVGVDSEIENLEVTETFICDGETNIFELKWLVDPDKASITALLDRRLVLSADYTIEYYKVKEDNFTKNYCRFKLLNQLPGVGQLLKITYKKHIDLYTAVDRINNLYNPTDTMPGKELPLLMSGAEYSSSVLQGLTFDYNPPWDQGVYDVNSAWSDLTDYYASANLVQNVSYGTSTLFLNTLNGISVGQKITLTTTATNYFKHNIAVSSINTATTSIGITDYTYKIKRIWSDSTSTQGTLVFYTKEYFGGDLKVGDIADISGVDNGTTVTGFDGRYVITGIGNDRFTAIGTGTHAASILSTASVRSLTSLASVYIPSVLEDLNVSRSFTLLRFTDKITADFVTNDYIDFDTKIPVDQVSGFEILSDAYGGNLLDIDSVAPGIEHYITSISTASTFVLSAYNIGPTTYRVKIYGYPKLEFWKDNFGVNGVDTEISAGSWDSTGNFVGALGVNPADLIRDGGKFLSIEHSHAPEEHVKGQVLESVGVSVYTQDNYSSPLVVSGTVPILENETSVTKLSQKINDAVAITIQYKGKIFDRLESPPNPEDIGPYYSPQPADPIGVVGAPIASSAGDDTFTGPYPLGFGWNMFGTVYTEVYVGTNGYITFGGGDSEYTPLNINALENPSIMVMYCDLWQNIGVSGQPLEGNQSPGLWFDSGTIGNFKYWRLRFQGSHYNVRNTSPALPAYQYEVGLYSDGINQYIEMIYEKTWRGTNFNGDVGFITGIANSNGLENVEVPYTTIRDYTSHVFYSTYNGGSWKYAGEGSFDPFKDPYIFTATNQFFVFEDQLYIAPQQSSGRAGYTMITMGGSYYLDSGVVSVTAATEAVVPSLSSIDDVKSAFVTVNGASIDAITTTSQYGYIIEPYGINNDRASVKVYNLPGTNSNVQAWFFGVNYPSFNSVFTEIFNITTATSLLTVTNMVSTIEPISSQVLVEYEPSGSVGRYRLNPPDVTYYQIGNNQLTFDIDPEPKLPGTYNINNIKVYANGVELRVGFDYTVDSSLNQITIAQNLLSDGDTIAIESLVDYDYVVAGDNIFFANPNIVTAGSVKVTTFGDHSGMVLRSERFKGTSNGRFVLSLPAVSASYVWMYVNGEQLTAGIHFEVLQDLRTVQLNELVVTTPNDEILITVINSPRNSSTILGYRVFKDIFGRNHYSRVSEFYSTRLAKELTVDDAVIVVDDASRLIPPNPAKNVPGVIYIDGERVEFFEKRDNTLSDLRRSTYGTGPAEFSEIGSKIIDQSLQQTVPYYDTVYKQYHITSSTTGTYVLTTVTNTFNTYTYVISTSSFEVNTGTVYSSWGDGIQLKDTAPYKDQVYVKYGGRLLRKSPITVHDQSKSYYSTNESLVEIPAEFDIVYNSSLGNYELQLNIADFVPGVRVEVMHTTGTTWQGTTTSLLVEERIEAQFLRLKTAELPDDYYYGGNPTLTDDANFELTDDDDNPLEGY